MADERPIDGDELGDDVPQELVNAGAPRSLSAWTDAQKDAYFRGEAVELIEGETPPRLEVAEIGGDGTGAGWG